MFNYQGHHRITITHNGNPQNNNTVAIIKNFFINRCNFTKGEVYINNENCSYIEDSVDIIKKEDTSKLFILENFDFLPTKTYSMVGKRTKTTHTVFRIIKNFIYISSRVINSDAVMYGSDLYIVVNENNIKTLKDRYNSGQVYKLSDFSLRTEIIAEILK
jgi:hypothetical protein